MKDFVHSKKRNAKCQASWIRCIRKLLLRLRDMLYRTHSREIAAFQWERDAVDSQDILTMDCLWNWRPIDGETYVCRWPEWESGSRNQAQEEQPTFIAFTSIGSRGSWLSSLAGVPQIEYRIFNYWYLVWLWYPGALVEASGRGHCLGLIPESWTALCAQPNRRMEKGHHPWSVLSYYLLKCPYYNVAGTHSSVSFSFSTSWLNPAYKLRESIHEYRIKEVKD